MLFRSEVDLRTTISVAPKLRGVATLVSESALTTLSEVAEVARAGARAVLIGSAFSSSDDIAAKVKEIMSW